jgi:hypothetical protein
MPVRKLLAPFAASFWLLFGVSSHAAILLNDNFDTENGGVPQLNYSGFANFNVANAGTGGRLTSSGTGSSISIRAMVCTSTFADRLPLVVC